MQDLTDLERQVLAFEAQRWNFPGAKDEEIVKTFGVTPTRYQQWVLQIIDKPTAYIADPVLVKRLRRLRDERRRRRLQPIT